MKYSIVFIITLFFAVGCGNQIKNEEAEVIIEGGTEVELSESNEHKEVLDEVEDTLSREDSIKFGMIQIFLSDLIDTMSHQYWVGSFKPHGSMLLEGKVVVADEALYWARENKISISIDKIVGDSVIGHSVVAGNDRPFHGTVDTTKFNLEFIVKEPGDHKYDGQFTFNIEGGSLIGEWHAYEKIDIPRRMYILSKETYKYNPDIMLEKRRYGDWTKVGSEEQIREVYDEGTEYEEVFEWVQKKFASTTSKIWEINASNTELTKEDVENLTSSDLMVIRNTIYARHGYSFKYRPLRVFFDRQDWYIPVHTDIRKEFTALEKKNIQLLLRYEKNAKEYYDTFGRG